jgi:lysophospholipase L1-like esterase
VDPRRFERNLERFVEVAREHGIHLLFVDYPLRAIERGESLGEEGEIVRYAMLGARSLEELHQLHRTAQRVVERVARREGVPFVETETALRASSQLPFSAYDLVHPNAVGARIVARRILERLRELGWLADPPSA